MYRFYSLLCNGVSLVALTCFANAAIAADVSSEAELNNMLQSGTDATLTADITLTGNLQEITTGNFSVNGGSHSISVGVDGDGAPITSAAGFNVGAGANVNFQNLTVSNLNQAIINSGTINTIDGVVFDGNNVTTDGADATGGAISNTGTIGTISNSEFRNNSVTADGGNARGGAIADTSGGTLNIINTSFYDNYAEVKGDMALGTEDTPATYTSAGGAIYSNGTVNITAQNQDVTFSGNEILSPSASGEGDGTGEETGSTNNAITMSSGTLNLTADNGNITFDDGISMSGGNLNLSMNNGSVIFNGAVTTPTLSYNMHISGSGDVAFNSEFSGIENFVVDSSNLILKSGVNLNVVNYTAKGDSVLSVTVDPDNLTSSVVNISGDVVGTTKVVVNATSETLVPSEQSILFVSASGDNKETAGDFVVYRVLGSPYMWTSSYQETVIEGEEGSEGNTGAMTSGGWYLSMTGESNPDYRPMAPEIASYLALHSLAIEQNRGVVNSIRNSVGSNKFILQRYGVLYEDGYMNKPISRLWVNPVYRYVQLTAPQEVDGTIAGFDAGLDFQSDASNKLGMFASYRYGTYDVGKDGYFKADMDSTIEISSYLLGLYYRYDYNNFWMFSTAYMGRQHAEIETDDKVRADADGMQYGAGLELGYAFVPGQNWTLEPSLGIFYTGIDYDDMEDKYAKSADYSMLNQIEGEFGIKLERTINHVYGFSKIYIKPSVIQTLNFGNEVKITHLNTVDTVDDQTLGRIEIGGRYALDNKMSLYGYVNYTTGTDYDDVAAGLGFNYRWH